MTLRLEHFPLPGQPSTGEAKWSLTQGHWLLGNLTLPEGFYRLSAEANVPDLVVFPKEYYLPLLPEHATWRFSDIRFQLTEEFNRPFNAGTSWGDFRVGGSIVNLVEPAMLTIYPTRIEKLAQLPPFIEMDRPVVTMPVTQPAPDTIPIARFPVSEGGWAYMGDGLYYGSYLVTVDAANIHPQAWLVNLPGWSRFQPTTDVLTFVQDEHY